MTQQVMMCVMEPIELQCPHCQGWVVVVELNCRIFRHAVMKATGVQVNPHASKAELDNLLTADAVYGCGKPFRVTVGEDGKFKTEPCDYI